MKKMLSWVLMLGLCTAISACGLTKEKLGMSKKAPNEFMVGSRAPLSLPPEFDLVPVTEPAAAAQNEVIAQEPAEDLSGADKKLLSKMGN